MRSIWERESTQGSSAFRRAASTIKDQVGKGRPLAEAMDACEKYFPPLCIAVVKAGEMGGRLERSFKTLGEYYDQIVQFRRGLLKRVAWPLFQLVAAIVILGLLILVMGWLTSFVPNAEPIDWLGLGWSTAQYFWGYVFCVTLVIGSLVGLVWAVKSGLLGDAPMRIARRIPVIGPTIEMFSLARFAWALGVVNDSGMNYVEGISLAFRATQNNYYESHQAAVANKLQHGKELHWALHETGVFPEEFLSYIQTAELAGQIPESMNRVAKDYLERTKLNLEIISNVTFMICLGTVAAFILIAVVLLYKRMVLDRYMNLSAMLEWCSWLV